MKYLIIVLLIFNFLTVIALFGLAIKYKNPKDRWKSKRYISFGQILCITLMIFMMILGNMNNKAEAEKIAEANIVETEKEKSQRLARILEKQEIMDAEIAKQEAEAKIAQEKYEAERAAREKEQAELEAKEKAEAEAAAAIKPDTSSSDSWVKESYGPILNAEVAKKIVLDHLRSASDLESFEYSNGNLSATIYSVSSKDDAALLYANIGDALLEYDEMKSLRISFGSFGNVSMGPSYIQSNEHGGRYYPSSEIEDQLGIVYGDEEYDDYDYDEEYDDYNYDYDDDDEY